jgi:hypothetical protein
VHGYLFCAGVQRVGVHPPLRHWIWWNPAVIGYSYRRRDLPDTEQEIDLLAKGLKLAADAQRKQSLKDTAKRIVDGVVIGALATFAIRAAMSQ